MTTFAMLAGAFVLPIAIGSMIWGLICWLARSRPLSELERECDVDAIVSAANLWFDSLESDGWTEDDLRDVGRPGLGQLYAAVCAANRRSTLIDRFRQEGGM